MTKRIILALLAAASLLLGACEKYETDPETRKSFKGDIIVTNGDGSTFTDKGIRSSCSETIGKPGHCDIFLKGVKFAKNMPVRIDMTIPAIPIDEEGNFSGENIVPWAMGGEFKQWTIKNIEGRITFTAEGEPETLSFDMMCADYPVTYEGIYTE